MHSFKHPTARYRIVRRSWTPAAVVIALVVAALALRSCRSSGSRSEGPQIVAIQVTPVNPTLAIRNTQQLTAVGRFSDESMQDVTGLVTWASSVDAIASVTRQGLVTAGGVGQAAVIASLDGARATTVVTVTR